MMVLFAVAFIHHLIKVTWQGIKTGKNLIQLYYKKNFPNDLNVFSALNQRGKITMHTEHHKYKMKVNN